MADLRRSVLELFQQGMDAVNTAVNHVTNATRSKMDELTLQNQRKELLDALANTVYEQWQQGLDLPEALTDKLVKLKEVDEQLAALTSKQDDPAPAASEQPETEAPEASAAQPEQTDDLSVPTIPRTEADAADAVEKTPVPTINVAPDEEADNREN